MRWLMNTPADVKSITGDCEAELRRSKMSRRKKVVAVEVSVSSIVEKIGSPRSR